MNDTKPSKKISVGRPRTVSLEPEEMKKLGEEMLKWIVENDAIHIKLFPLHKGISRKDFNAMRMIPEFLHYYETALDIVSVKYIDGTINNSIAQRFLRHYFGELRQDDTKQKKEDLAFQKEIAEFMHVLKKEVLENVSDDVKKQFDSLMTQITTFQTKKKK